MFLAEAFILNNTPVQACLSMDKIMHSLNSPCTVNLSQFFIVATTYVIALINSGL